MNQRLPREFITTIQSKDGPKEFVLLSGLLALAHDEGLKQVQTELIQIPSEANHFLAIAQVTVTTAKGVFMATGDASPENVAKLVARHITRMAETRALARALRWATNIAMTAFEELGEPETESSPKEPSVMAKPVLQGVSQPITQAQVQAIQRLSLQLGWGVEKLKQEVNERFHCLLVELDRRQASRFIQTLQEQRPGAEI